MRRIGCLLAASTMTLAAAACSSSTPPTLHAGTYTASGEQTPLDQIHLFKYANGQLVGTVVLGAPTDSAHANLAFIIDKPNDVLMHARFATGTATIDHISAT